MKTLIKALEYFLSLPISFYVSIRLCGFKSAFKFPILIRYNSILRRLNGEVCGANKFGVVRIGFGEVGIFDKKYERSIVEISGTWIVKGKTVLGHGSRICIYSNALLITGNNLYNTAKATIVCKNKVNIGDNVLISWETMIVDTDFHRVKYLHDRTNSCPDGFAEIGNDVWIGMRSVILKNTIIPKGCIIGAYSLCNKNYMNEYSLIAGNPATVRKNGVTLMRTF